MPEPLLRVDNLSRFFKTHGREVRALDGVSLDVEPGEFVSLKGPSGSGKTSLFNLIGGLDRPTSGSIYVNGREVHGQSASALARFRGENIGFVFQDFNLCETMTAIENVMLGAVLTGAAPGAARKRAFELLERMELEDRISHRPWELSGGQQQRIAIARALINHPCLVLADEPTGNLDEEAAGKVIDLFLALRDELNLTLLVATHDAKLLSAADRVIHIQQGRLKESVAGV
ncbi:MAG: ABC transporter ATP-binding protein [Candidatus Sumerlaeia bacterium]